MSGENQPFDVKELAEKWLLGTLAPEERDRFEKWYANFDDEVVSLSGSEYPDTEALRKAIFDRIDQVTSTDERVTRRVITWRRVAVAASIVFFVSVSLYWYVNNKRLPTQPVAQNIAHDVAPGGNKAILTLAGGRKIILDNTANGLLARQGNAQVVNQNGLLAYRGENSVTGAGENSVFNTLTTPRGGQYQLTLPDGSRVWLNAASSITYPIAFTGNKREVTVTGEAYLVISKDKRRPFHVCVNGMDIQVLGTEFDVNAYPDETAMKTTLVQGSVKLVKAGESLLLKPGQEGETEKGAKMVLEKHPDLNQVLAWKNGYFSFEGADIKTIMRQISRWYNVEVHYEGTPTNGLFGGQIGRNLNLTEVLTGLSASNVHFTLEGRVLTVLP